MAAKCVDCKRWDKSGNAPSDEWMKQFSMLHIGQTPYRHRCKECVEEYERK